MRIGLGVLRIERRHKSALLPKLAFNGQLQLLGLVDRIAIAVRIDIVRFGKSAFVIEAVQSIIAHTRRSQLSRWPDIRYASDFRNQGRIWLRPVSTHS